MTLAAWIGGEASPGYVPLGLAKVPRGSIPYSIIQHIEIVQGGDHGHMRGIKLDPGLLRHRQGPFSVCELTEARVSGLRSPLTFLLRCPESFLDHVPAVMLTWALPQTRPLEAYSMGPLSSWSLSPGGLGGIKRRAEFSREREMQMGLKERAPAQQSTSFLPHTVPGRAPRAEGETQTNQDLGAAQEAQRTGSACPQ